MLAFIITVVFAVHTVSLTCVLQMYVGSHNYEVAQPRGGSCAEQCIHVTDL